jgi:maltooligosyltrehalose trehalohydrolase
MERLIDAAGVQSLPQIDRSNGVSRRHVMPFGAQYIDARQGTRFRLWAPSARDVTLLLEERPYRMQVQEEGWYQLVVPEAAPGTLYRFCIENERGEQLVVPDPASRFQPRDVHGPSMVVAPERFRWRDDDWKGRPWEEAVIYEMHVGAFTPQRTFQGVQGKLGYLADLGITAIELMPIADFPGTRNWGYDGVLPFAPESRYGTPEDLKELVQAAHAHGIMVILDVVYNHFGPEGNYLHAYASPFFDTQAQTPWGAAINFSGDGVEPCHAKTVRDFFIHNAVFWLEEYHLDGLRLDAVHAIHDRSARHFLEELAETVRDALPDRHVHLILENSHNQSSLLKPAQYTAQWNDDFHHTVHVLITGEKAGYYADYTQERSPLKPIEHLARCLSEGFSYQGEFSPFHGGSRGEVSRDLPPTAFVNFLQNHDQIGNRALGERLSKLASPPALKAAASILLLAPGIPLLFMGEEWQSERPFSFFCDFEPDLNEKVREGRKREFAAFPEFNNPEILKKIPDATAYRTFEASTLDWAEAQHPPHNAWRALYKELLEIRHEEIMPRLKNLPPQPEERYRIIDDRSLVAWWQLADQTQLILLANFGDKETALPHDERLQRLTPIWQSNYQTEFHCQSGKLPAMSVLWAIVEESAGETV